MLIVSCEIGPSKIHGLGVFAKENVKKGAVVWVSHKDFDVYYTEEQINRLHEVPRANMFDHVYINPKTGKYVLCGDEARYMNHSDDYNIVSHHFASEEEARSFGLGDEVDWVEGISIAARDITKGEELTCDYKEFDLDARRKLGDYY